MKVTPERFPGATIDGRGALRFGGADTVELAKRFGTPLYVMDGDMLRGICREFRDEFGKRYPGESLVLYASKALSALAVLRVAAEEGLGADAASPGELYGALKAGMPPERVYLHGNFKKAEELEYALKRGVGRIVVDSDDEAEALDAAAGRLRRKARALVRITPGVEAHVHEMVQVGKLDTKFGMPLQGGAALRIVKKILGLRNVELCGVHFHLGSQILDTAPYALGVERGLDFLAELKKRLGYEAAEFDIGGGFPVRYTSAQPLPAVGRFAGAVVKSLVRGLKERGLAAPKLLLEPGRALVSPTTLTLYTVGPVKRIPGVRTYVSVDGGISDNPRPALYGSVYEAVIANRAGARADGRYRVCGRHCESDNLIMETPLAAPKRGDVMAVFTTGAYNFSMSSNYNKFPRPAMVMLEGGRARVIVKREKMEELYARDV